MKMNSKAQHQLEALDPGMLKNMMKLYRKLKGLSAEIHVNLENPFVFDEAFRVEFVEKLSLLSHDIDRAIGGIDEMIALIANQDEETNKEFLALPEMQAYKKSLGPRLAEFKKMKIEF